MEFAFIVWAIGTLPAIAKVLVPIGVMGSIFILIVKGVCIAEGENIRILRYLFLTVPIALIGGAIPDKETAYAMAAAYGVQQVAQNERVQNLAGNGLDVLEAYLEKTKKELEKDTK